jgi:hypothetical protein
MSEDGGEEGEDEDFGDNDEDGEDEMNEDGESE